MRALSSFGVAVSAAAIVLVSAGGCSTSSDSGTVANADELFESGPYQVGYREMTLTYSDAEGLLAYPYGELMASHGWVLVAPNHTGNTALELAFGPADPSALVALDRPTDITAIIDEFDSGLSGDELEGKADVDASRVYAVAFCRTATSNAA